MKSALPSSFTDPIFASWQRALERNEVCAVLAAPFSGRERRIQGFLEWQQQTNGQVASCAHLQTDLLIDPEKCKSFFSQASTPLILSPGEILLASDAVEYAYVLAQLAYDYHKGVLIFFEVPKLAFDDLPTDVSSKLLQNCSFLPLLGKKETDHFIAHLAERWQLSVSDKQSQMIYEHTGGHMWLIKEVLRQFADEQKQSLSTIFSSATLKWKVQKIWLQLPKQHRVVLTSIGRGTIAEHSGPVLDDLQQLGFVSSSHQIKSVALREISQDAQVQIRYENQHIYFNDIDVTSVFTAKERNIFAAFYSAADRRVTRDALAAALWSEQEQSEYTEWALDKAISRFKKKLEKLGIAKSSVVTIRDYGYQFKVLQS